MSQSHRSSTGVRAGAARQHVWGFSGRQLDQQDEPSKTWEEHPRNEVSDAVEQVLDRSRGDQPLDQGERGQDEMAEGELNDPAEYANSDVPSRFDISGYRNGLFGGPSADLFGESGSIAESGPGGGQSAMVTASPPMDPVTETGSLVRPYTRTGGRTRSDYDLAIEALVSTSESGWEIGQALLPEHRSICDLCTDTRSVAEVAAHLRLPLGVVRVLIGDMAGMGLVVIHSTDAVVGDRPSMEFLERVLSGLRRL